MRVASAMICYSQCRFCDDMSEWVTPSRWYIIVSDAHVMTRSSTWRFLMTRCDDVMISDTVALTIHSEWHIYDDENLHTLHIRLQTPTMIWYWKSWASPAQWSVIFVPNFLPKIQSVYWIAPQISVLTDIIWKITISWEAGIVVCKLIRYTVLDISLGCLHFW